MTEMIPMTHVRPKRGVAYQMELYDDSIFTGTWTGWTSGSHYPVWRHVDTGEERCFGAVRWYALLSEVA